MPDTKTDEIHEYDDDIQAVVKDVKALVFESADRTSAHVAYLSRDQEFQCERINEEWVRITHITESNATKAANKGIDNDDEDEEDDEEEDEDTDGDEDKDDEDEDDEDDEEDDEDDITLAEGGYVLVEALTFKDEKGSHDSEDEEEDEDEILPFYNDDAFTDTFADAKLSTMTTEEYIDNLAKGLKIEDIRGILGMPHQFLPNADVRDDYNMSNDTLGDSSSLGRLYLEKIIRHIPLLLITPGTPNFMSTYSKRQRTTMLENLGIPGFNDVDLKELVNNHKGKYYTLKYSFTEYTWYLNAMLRSAAIFLEIGDEKVGNQKLKNFNWLYYTTNPDSDGYKIFSHGDMYKVLGPYTGCLAIYADCGTSVDDSFSNSTTQSQMSSALNSLSDTGREMNFIIGNVGGAAGLALSKLTGLEDFQNNQAAIASIIDTAMGSNNILSDILGKCQTILAGGRMVFPEIWAESSFSRSYSCKMKLVSPAGDRLSVFLNILVPIYHILALTLPRQSIGQTYFSPFLVRAFCKGLFNVDMGIITDLSINKGAEGEWTVDGIPTVAELSFTIKDLYDGMFMSKTESLADTSVMSNITELDYIANSCGVNINDHDVFRTIKLYAALGFYGFVKDVGELNILGGIVQGLSNIAQGIFGAF